MSFRYDVYIHIQGGKSLIIMENSENIYRTVWHDKNKQKRGSEISLAVKLPEREGNFNCAY